MVKVKLNQAFVELLLARRNISQNHLARQLGVSSSYMAQMMHGERCPGPRLRQRIVGILNPLSFDDLFIIEHYRIDSPGEKAEGNRGRCSRARECHAAPEA